MTSRRAFLGGLIGIAAPAIVPYKALMPVKLFTTDYDEIRFMPLAQIKAEGAAILYDSHLEALLESMRLTKERMAADFFNGVFGNVTPS